MEVADSASGQEDEAEEMVCLLPLPLWLPIPRRGI